MVLVSEMDEAEDAPEVVDPVGVVERHTPAVRLRRETAQKEHSRSFGQEWLERVKFCVHPRTLVSVGG